MTAGEAVVLRDGSWAATLVAYCRIRACPVHETKQACHDICVPAWNGSMSVLDTHECSSCKSCG